VMSDSARKIALRDEGRREVVWSGRGKTALSVSWAARQRKSCNRSISAAVTAEDGAVRRSPLCACARVSRPILCPPARAPGGRAIRRLETESVASKRYRTAAAWMRSCLKALTKREVPERREQRPCLVWTGGEDGRQVGVLTSQLCVSCRALPQIFWRDGLQGGPIASLSVGTGL
jgi:hypothetical protein